MTTTVHHSLHQEVLEHIAEIIVVADSQGIITYLNQAGIRHLAEDALGQQVESFLNLQFLEQDTSAGENFDDSWFGKLLTGSSIVRRDVSITTAADGESTFEMDAKPLSDNRDTILIVLRDVTEKRKFIEESRDSDILSNRIFDSSLDAIGVYRDMPPTHYMVNSAYVKLFGYADKSELIGTSSLQLIAPSQRDNIRSIIKGRIQGENIPLTYISRGLRKDGSEFDLEIHSSTFHIQGTMFRLSILRDVTETLKQQRSLAELNNQLEQRVANRTRELFRANEKLQTEAQSRIDLEAQMRLLTEKEQDRIGKDLHDGLGQDLTAITFMLQALRQHIKSGDDERIHQSLDNISEITTNSITKIRDIARGLSPFEINTKGILVALQNLAQYTENLYGIDCHFSHNCTEEKVDTGISNQLFRIAQEAVTNAVRHAKATAISIEIYCSENLAKLIIRDNGIGLAASKTSGHSGFGLHTMENRAKLIGGTFSISENFPSGVVVTCEFEPPGVENATRPLGI